MSVENSTEDPGKRLLRGLVNELLRRVEDPTLAAALTAAEINQIRQLCSDNSVSLASIRAGDFGEVAKHAAEQYPFEEGSTVSMQ